ncbi:MAG: helix-turn-helix transcriptional regulator [Candidatus Bathyarchaeota archaeon]|nr:helix-turn-helix transcriptional regulator [Candidatus Bathyarchaeota archaeon]
MTDEILQKELRQRLVNQFLDFIILEKLKTSNNPISGRRIINKINDMFSVTVDDGIVFSVLLIMERKNWIRGKSKEVHGRTRRIYKLTITGEQRLNSYIECREEIINFMKILLEARIREISQ